MRNKTVLILLLTALVSISNAREATFSDQLEPEAVTEVMTAVADWQLENPSRHRLTDWTQGALFAGMTAWAQMAETDKYMLALKDIGQRTSWQLGPRRYHADDHTVGQMYLTLYTHYRQERMLRPTLQLFDWILENPSTVSLRRDRQHGRDRYWWCDALFMAPPVWAKLTSFTGDMQYLDYMNHEWWAATDYLYDPTEQLYFRDDYFFDLREENGEKIFWSRGNGWVFGGLVRVLESMPLDYPDRDRYIQLYREMSGRLIEIQGQDGMWRSSLLYPERYPAPESSGTGFFTYGLTWGINRGILDKETYGPAVTKAWQGLVRNVHPDGKLGYVQRIAADPMSTGYDETEIYGVGAFLLAGSEIHKMAVAQDADTTLVHLVNPIAQFRDSETISLDFEALQADNGSIAADNVAVFDFRHNRFLLTQVVDNDGNGTYDELLFQVDFAPGQQRWLWVMPLPAHFEKPTSQRQARAMFVPERMDDMAWENDRIGFRTWGPALEQEMVSRGIDVFVKRVSYPVLESWYEQDNYHEDHGEGLDYYAVGQTLGCGGAGILSNRTLHTSGNFSDHRILANGPIRTIFELDYEEYDAGDLRLSETKRVSLDLGSNLSRYEINYDGPQATIRAAAGVVMRDGHDSRYARVDQGWISYWEPAHPDHGTTGVAIVVDPAAGYLYDYVSNHMMITSRQSTSEPFIYYAGAGWDRSGHFSNARDWNQYVSDFAGNLANPIEIVIE